MYSHMMNTSHLGKLNSKNFMTHFPTMNGNYNDNVAPVSQAPKKFATLKEVYNNPPAVQQLPSLPGFSSNPNEHQYISQPATPNTVVDTTTQQYANYHHYFELQNQAIAVWSSSQYAVDRYYQLLFAGFNPLAGYRNLDGTPMDPWICGPVPLNDNAHLTNHQASSSIGHSAQNSMNLDGFSSFSQPETGPSPWHYDYVPPQQTAQNVTSHVAKINDLSRSTSQKTDSAKEDVKNVLKLMKKSESLRDYRVVQGLPEVPLPYHIYYVSKPEEVRKALSDANEVLTLDLNNNDRSKTSRNAHSKPAGPMSPLNKSYSEEWPELGASVDRHNVSTSKPKTPKKQGQGSGRNTSRFMQLKKTPEDYVIRLEPAQFVPVYARLSTSPVVRK